MLTYIRPLNNIFLKRLLILYSIILTCTIVIQMFLFICSTSYSNDLQLLLFSDNFRTHNFQADSHGNMFSAWNFEVINAFTNMYQYMHQYMHQ